MENIKKSAEGWITPKDIKYFGVVRDRFMVFTMWDKDPGSYPGMSRKFKRVKVKLTLEVLEEKED